MNYLAHIALSGTDMEIALGNFMGDGVKGAIPEDYPLKIRVGLYLHRFIDYQSDTHPENLEMRISLREKYAKYAGVVQDMYHDHFLSKYWSDYHEVPIDNHLKNFFTNTRASLDMLPHGQRSFYLGMEEGLWLTGYGTFGGLNRAFSGLSKRSVTAGIMEDGALFLSNHYEVFEQGFRQWYPLLKDLCEKERKDLLKKLSNS